MLDCNPNLDRWTWIPLSGECEEGSLQAENLRHARADVAL